MSQGSMSRQRAIAANAGSEEEPCALGLERPAALAVLPLPMRLQHDLTDGSSKGTS